MAEKVKGAANMNVRVHSWRIEYNFTAGWTVVTEICYQNERFYILLNRPLIHVIKWLFKITVPVRAFKGVRQEDTYTFLLPIMYLGFKDFLVYIEYIHHEILD